MDISVLQENLKLGLSMVGGSVGSPRSSLPVTSNVLLETGSGLLKLHATNLETHCKTEIGAMVTAEGATSVPHRLLNDIVGSLPEDRIDLTLETGEDENDSRVLVVRCGRSVTRLNTAHPRDFPVCPEVDRERMLEIPADLFRKAARATSYSAAREDSRPTLAGVLVKATDGKLTMAAADGFRLAVYTDSLPDGDGDLPPAVLHRQVMDEITRLTSPRSETIRMAISESQQAAAIELDDCFLATHLINGAFPNYEQLIPASQEHSVVIPTADFQTCLRQAAVFAQSGGDVIRLMIAADADHPGAGILSVSGASEGKGENRAECAVAALEGGDHHIAFNFRYLLDLAHHIPAEAIRFTTDEPAKPGVFRPAALDGSDAAPDETFVQVIMPMYVQW